MKGGFFFESVVNYGSIKVSTKCTWPLGERFSIRRNVDFILFDWVNDAVDFNRFGSA